MREPKKLKKVLKIVRWEKPNISASHKNFKKVLKRGSH